MLHRRGTEFAEFAEFAQSKNKNLLLVSTLRNSVNSVPLR